MADYKEKIKKLLALAESPNEFEARDALLKAKALMAEHKLTEEDCKDAGKKKVCNIMTDWQCSKRFEPWMIQLSTIIGVNFCCQTYRSHGYREQMQHIGVIGFEEDVEMFKIVFGYAVDSIRSRCKEIRKENSMYDFKYAKRCMDSFGYGFSTGVYEAFQRQEENAEEGWGLVMQMPQEVKDYTADQGMREESFDKDYGDRLTGDYIDGYEEGKKFDVRRRVQGTERQPQAAIAM